MGAVDRRTRVLGVVADLAARHGVGPLDLTILKDSNNTVVDLGPPRVVAKVATTTLSSRRDAFAQEFAVLQYLRSSRAPVVRLSDKLPHGPHELDGLRVLFLDRVRVIADPVAVDDAVDALDQVHVALAGFDEPVAAFTDSLAHALALYSDETVTQTLEPIERRFCIAAGERLLADFSRDAGQPMVLHGDPWIGGNLVATSQGPVLLDFEAVCVGPREWDLSSLGEGAGPHGRPSLFERCLAARSFLVAALCLAQPGRALEIDEAATCHLMLLHERMPR